MLMDDKKIVDQHAYLARGTLTRRGYFNLSKSYSAKTGANLSTEPGAGGNVSLLVMTMYRARKYRVYNIISTSLSLGR